MRPGDEVERPEISRTKRGIQGGSLMTLFTKEGCLKCEYLKKKIDLEALGISVEILGPENPDALAHLAWHGLVGVAENHLPILVLDDSTYIADVVPILRYLTEMARKGAAAS